MRNGVMSHTRGSVGLLLAVVVVSCCRLGRPVIGAHAFVTPRGAPVACPSRARAPRPPTAVPAHDHNDGEFDLDLLVRRVKRADKILVRRLARADRSEVRTDAALAAAYVLGRFLAYDVGLAVGRLAPGWEAQDVVWLAGTCSSATVLVAYYVVAGLCSRTYEVGASFAPAPAAKALVNVALCCPAWLATEHLMGYGPSNIAGETFGGAIATGLVGLGSFMALAKTLSAEMR